MTAFKGLGTYGNAVGVVTPSDHKQDNSGLVVKTAGNAIRAGLFWGGTASIVSGAANMSYNVAAYTIATSRGATSGTVLGGNDGTFNVVTGAAPGSNSRIDVVYHWQREFSIDGVDSNPVIGVVQGTAAASPTVPSLAAFPGAVALAQILVPTGVTATNTGTTFTHVAPFTAASGGIVVVRNSTELGALPLTEGLYADQLDIDVLFRCNGTSYVALGGSSTGTLTPTGTFSVAAGYTTKLEKNGNIVTLAFALTNSASTSTASIPSGASMATLPAGFRPTSNPVTSFVGYNNSGAILITYTIDTSGVIRVYPQSGLGGTAILYGSVSFSVA